MSYAVQQAALAAVVKAAAGTPIYWEGQGKARPPYPYVALKIINSSEVGFGEVRRTMADDQSQLNVSIRHDEELTLSVNAYAKPVSDFDGMSITYARKIARTFARPDVQKILGEAGIALAIIGATLDLSGMGDGGEISRTQMDLQFNTAAAEVASPEQYFTRINATISLKSPDPSLPARETEFTAATGA